MMDALITRFPAQLEEALDIGSRAEIRPLDTPVSHVYVTGLGGSGIGADFVASFVYDTCGIPYLVGKGYEIPAYIGKETLAIASSYSGNTEETLMAFDAIRRRDARIIVVASGGALIRAAEEQGLDHIRVPDSWPSPRACLGYSVVAQLSILQKTGLANDTQLDAVRRSVALLQKEQNQIRERAEKIAAILYGKTPVIYATDRFTPVAVRFRQQINENSKMLCWHHVVPEMNHNELVGWRDTREDIAVVWFRSRQDHQRNQVRIDINKEIINNYTGTMIELWAKGETMIEQSFYLVHLGDWISWYLAQLRGVDAIEVKVIDYLKSELAKS